MKSPKQLKDYRDRVRRQTMRWCFGFPEHNIVDDECCPDFSCCNPSFFNKDADKRWSYYNKVFPRED